MTRRAVQKKKTTPKAQTSFAVAARKFIGSVDGGPGDLSTNRRHLKHFGKPRQSRESSC